MIDFGYTLRQAREQKGLTTRQIADSTHMMEQMVVDLENEEFGRIAAPIYGRGFVKLYCEAVGLDPKPLVAEFMEIFNGNRPPTIRRRDEPTPEPAAAPLPTPAPEPAPMPAAAPVQETFSAAEPELPAEQPAEAAAEPAFTLESLRAEPEPVEEDDGIIPAATDPFSKPVTAAEPPVQDDPLFAFAQRPEPSIPQDPDPEPEPLLTRGPSRFAAPTPVDDEPRGLGFSVPPAVWRLLAIVGVALLLLWLIFAALRALYTALTGPSNPPADTPVETDTKPAVTAPATPGEPAPRKPMDLPPLYID